MLRRELPWQVVAVGWVLLTAGIVAMLGVVLLSVFATAAPPNSYVSVPPYGTSKYVVLGNFTPPVQGLVKFDNSSDAQALASASGLLARPPTDPVPRIPIWGIMRLENLSFMPEQGQMLFLCGLPPPLPGPPPLSPPPPPPPVTVADMQVPGRCKAIPAIRLYTTATTPVVAASGSYDVLLQMVFDSTEFVELVFVKLRPGTPDVQNITSSARLCSACTPTLILAPNGGLGSSGQDLGLVFGVYSDYTRFVMLVSILLVVECGLSLLLTWERRHHQFLTLLLCILIALQDSMIVLFTSRTVISRDTDVNTLCLGLGSVFHLFVVSSLAWYCAASLHVFFLFFRNGKYQRFTFTRSRKMARLYHIVCWSFVLLNFVIVWGLYALPPKGATNGNNLHPYSYGPVPPYSFCWIFDSSVLIGAFYGPALAVLAVSLVTTVIVCVQVCSVRTYHRGVTVQTIVEVMSIFLTCAGGLIALVVLGTLLVIYSDNGLAYMLLVAALLFFLQALALWLVVFPRKQNMILWALVLSCSAKGLQRKGSSLKDLTDSQMFQRSKPTGDSSSTPAGSPATSPTASVSSGVVEL